MSRDKKPAVVEKSTGDDARLSLEFLKLVYRHDKDPASLVERALELKRLLLEPES